MAQVLTERQYFALKKLHSLSGVVPVGLFLLEHVLYTNSFSTKGPEAYNDQVAFLTSLPYLYMLEIFGIALPILFHGLVGVYIAVRARHNLTIHNTRQNWMYALQRYSGLFLLAYIAYHVWTTRFSGEHDLFALMQHKLENPAIMAFYVLGVVAAAFHFGNGLWGFCVSWGITVTKHSQDLMHKFAMAVFVVMAFAGINSLLGFKGQAITFLQRPAEATAGAHAETPLRVEFPTDAASAPQAQLWQGVAGMSTGVGACAAHAQAKGACAAAACPHAKAGMPPCSACPHHAASAPTSGPTSAPASQPMRACPADCPHKAKGEPCPANCPYCAAGAAASVPTSQAVQACPADCPHKVKGEPCPANCPYCAAAAAASAPTSGPPSAPVSQTMHTCAPGCPHAAKGEPCPLTCEYCATAAAASAATPEAEGLNL